MRGESFVNVVEGCWKTGITFCGIARSEKVKGRKYLVIVV